MCTGITLKAKDGAIVYGRTLEWGSFDLKSRVILIPRGYEFVGSTPDGKPGAKWRGKYGVVGIDILERDLLGDGINETGLAAGLFYHPGFANYAKYIPDEAKSCLAPTDLMQFILTQFASVKEVIDGVNKIKVVPVIEPALGFAAPIHLIVTEPSGKAIVIEFLNGNMKIFDNPLGVITNAPGFNWHMTNLRNYINLSPVAIPSKKIEDLDFAPLGAGSGMIGLPGDFTPPSRFIRAVAFSQTARPTATGEETIYEVFRILDNFNVPLGAAEGSDDEIENTNEMRSSTIWTTANDLKNMLFYYHTQHNRRVRKIALKALSFDKIKGDIIHFPLDQEKAQDFEDITQQLTVNN